MSQPSIIVIGSTGLIGREVCKELECVNAHFKTASRHLDSDILIDLADENTFSNIEGVSNASILLLAASTNMSACDEDVDLSWKVNATNTISLIDQLIKQDNFVVYTSTNLVLGSDEPCLPKASRYKAKGIYAKSKMAVEQHLSTLDAHCYAIVRLAKVLSSETSLIKNWRKKLEKSDAIEAFYDHYLAPVSIQDTVKLLVEMAKKKPSGMCKRSFYAVISPYLFAP